MRIRCWGARGSIPVSGKEYLQYGGDTTCLEVRAGKGEILIIDAGSGIRRLGRHLIEEGKYSFSMLFTHAHWDHILGFPFFAPIYRREVSLGIYGWPGEGDPIEQVLSRTMLAPFFPVDFAALPAEISFPQIYGGSFSIGSLTISPIPLSHPNGGFGYKISEEGRGFVFLTDNELALQHPGGLDFSAYVDVCRGADLLIHDASFTAEEYRCTRSWGHSVDEDALRLALEAGVKRFGLFHHNPQRTDSEVNGILDLCRKIVRDRGQHLECQALSQETQIEL